MYVPRDTESGLCSLILYLVDIGNPSAQFTVLKLFAAIGGMYYFKVILDLYRALDYLFLLKFDLLL